MNSSIWQSCWMLVAAALYTVMAIFMKYAIETFSVYEFIFYRSILGLLMVIAILRKCQISIKTTIPHWYFCRICFSLVNLSLGAYILWILPIGTAQTLKYTGPLFFALILAIETTLLGNKFPKNLLIPLFSGFIGVAMIARPDIDPGLLFGMLLGIIAGLAGGLGDYFIRFLTNKGEPSERILFWFVIAGIVYGFIGTVMGEGFHSMSWVEFLLLVGIGISGTLAQYANTYAYEGGDSLLNNIFLYSGVFFSVIAGTIIFNERPEVLTIIGSTLICLSGILAGYLKYRNNEYK
ncbi:MAG: DMT family transporter [Burkholderiaceae bacterium]|nr:DMT family transporter [Burkholderiaceae bacterium]